jgi:hypothetical protein
MTISPVCLVCSAAWLVIAIALIYVLRMTDDEISKSRPEVKTKSYVFVARRDPPDDKQEGEK